MKKRYSILLTALLIIFTTISSYASVEFPAKTDVPLNKDWTIRFNMNIDESTINEDNVYILDSIGNEHDCELLFPDLSEYNFIQITPKTNYNPGEQYTLYIKDIKSISGKDLKDEISMNFSTVNNSNGVINFSDENLEEAIRQRIDKPTGDIFKTDIEDITELYFYSRKISNLEGIQYLTNLQKLNLADNEISDISILKDLTDLKWLAIYNNKISDISPLKNLTNLETLLSSENEISDISALEDLTNLKVLNLRENKISDISALEDLMNLEVLGLWYNKISDISALENLTNLQELSLSYNEISDIDSLKNLKDLQDLSLSDNKISDISSLKDLTNLKWLAIKVNEINDISSLKKLKNLELLHLMNNRISDISALKDLTNLTELFLSGNPITDFSPTSGYYDNIENKDFELNSDNNSDYDGSFSDDEDPYEKDFVDILSGDISIESNVVTAKLEFRNLPEKLTFNIESTEDGHDEYWWRISITDKENEYILETYHYKESNSDPVEMSILEGTETNVWLVEEDGWYQIVEGELEVDTTNNILTIRGEIPDLHEASISSIKVEAGFSSGDDYSYDDITVIEK